MTEAQIREAHAAIVEREENIVRMINSWNRNEEISEFLVWPTLEMGAEALSILPEIALESAESPGEADHIHRTRRL